VDGLIPILNNDHEAKAAPEKGPLFSWVADAEFPKFCLYLQPHRFCGLMTQVVVKRESGVKPEQFPLL
jgi:hypothetical protein